MATKKGKGKSAKTEATYTEPPYATLEAEYAAEETAAKEDKTAIITEIGSFSTNVKNALTLIGLCTDSARRCSRLIYNNSGNAYFDIFNGKLVEDCYNNALDIVAKYGSLEQCIAVFCPGFNPTTQGTTVEKMEEYIATRASYKQVSALIIAYGGRAEYLYPEDPDTGIAQDPLSTVFGSITYLFPMYIVWGDTKEDRVEVVRGQRAIERMAFARIAGFDPKLSKYAEARQESALEDMLLIQKDRVHIMNPTMDEGDEPGAGTGSNKRKLGFRDWPFTRALDGGEAVAITHLGILRTCAMHASLMCKYDAFFTSQEEQLGWTGYVENALILVINPLETRSPEITNVTINAIFKHLYDAIMKSGKGPKGLLDSKAGGEPRDYTITGAIAYRICVSIGGGITIHNVKEFVEKLKTSTHQRLTSLAAQPLQPSLVAGDDDDDDDAFGAASVPRRSPSSSAAPAPHSGGLKLDAPPTTIMFS